MQIEMKEDMPVTKEVEHLVSYYDFYTEMIENSGQRQSAREANRELEIKLRALGVTRISNGNFTYTI